MAKYQHITARDLREVVDIQAMTVVNTSGHKSKSYATRSGHGTVPAKVEFMTPRENIAAGRPEGAVSITAVVRDEITVVATDRVAWGGDNYYVQGPAVHVDRRRRFKKFIATKTDKES